MAFITVAQAKAQLNIDPADTTYDTELATYVDAASKAAEIARGEIIEQRSVTDELWLCQANSFLLRSSPVSALVSVAAVDGSATWTVANLHVDSSGLVTVLNGNAVNGLVAVTYTAGYATVPLNYQLAALIILQHLWDAQQRNTMQVLAAGVETTPVLIGFLVPNQARQLLGSNLPGIA